jgi:opine dehydrogenase
VTGIAIIGYGNSGCVHVAQLSKDVRRVRLLKASHSLHEGNFEHMVHGSGIALQGFDDSEGLVEISRVTRDPKEAEADLPVNQ